MTETATRAGHRTSAMAPVPYRVRSKVVENADSVTLYLEPIATELPRRGPASS